MIDFIKGRFVLLSLLSVFGYLIFVQEVTLIQKQEATQATKQPTLVDLTFVKEVSLAGNRDAKMTFFQSKQTENPIPKIEVYEKRIVFYDENGNRISERRYDDTLIPIRVSASGNQKFFHTRRVILPAVKKKKGEEVVEFLTDKGELLWSKRVVTEYDEYSSGFVVSNTGKVVEIQVMYGTLIFYTKTGSRLNEASVFEPTSELEISYNPHFSADGKFFAVATTPSYPHKSKVHLFTSEGKELWRFPTQWEHGDELFFSKDNKYIVTAHSDIEFTTRITYVFDVNTGILVFERKDMLPRHVKFFQVNTEDYILINYQAGTKVQVIDIRRAQTIPIYSVEPQGEIIAIAVTKKNRVIGIIIGSIHTERGTGRGRRGGGRKYFQDPYVAFFDLNGISLGKAFLPTQQIDYSPGATHLIFLDNGKGVVGLTQKKKHCSLILMCING